MLQASLTNPIPFFYTREYGYDPYEYREIEKPKYTIIKTKTHATIITEPHSELPKWHVFTLPIKHVLHVNTRLLKILFKENLITQQQIQLAYNQWVAEESELILIKTNHKNQLAERIKIPVRRRGNEHYHKYTWSRLQWYELIFDSLPQIYQKTTKKRKTQREIKKRKRHVHLCNTFLVTHTYNPENFEAISEAWDSTSQDMNRYNTNLKGRLKRRENELSFYVKALESHKSGMPHIHLLIKLKNPIECEAIPRRAGTVYRPFETSLFRWKYGFTDVKGIKQNKNIFGYICKYITKNTNPNNAKPNKTLALTWASQKRLYSNSMFDLFKWKFPNLSKKMNLTQRFTINKAIDLLWNGLYFPKIPWNLVPQTTKASLGYKRRFILDLHAGEELRKPLESRLNNEGFYQVTALRCLKTNGEAFAIPLERFSRRLLEYLRKKRTRMKQVR